MRAARLVARENDAGNIYPTPRGSRFRGRQIGAEGAEIAALLQAVEVRERMRRDFLAWGVLYLLQQRKREVIGIVLLVAADSREIAIRRQLRIGIGRQLRRQRAHQFVFVGAEQKADRRPGTGYAARGEQIEQRRHHLAHAENITLLIGDGALVAHALHQLEIERDHESAARRVRLYGGHGRLIPLADRQKKTAPETGPNGTACGAVNVCVRLTIPPPAAPGLPPPPPWPRLWRRPSRVPRG